MQMVILCWEQLNAGVNRYNYKLKLLILKLNYNRKNKITINYLYNCK